MLGLFPFMKYKPWYALGELVDNAVQSSLSNLPRLRDVEGSSYRLRVEIELSKDDGGTIVIRDNAAGIAARDWTRAFLVAEPPPDATGLSQFGIGMKAACCWFAREWSVRSSALGESVERTAVLDVPRIIETRNEKVSVVEEPAHRKAHFTEIRMWNLNRVPQTKTIGKMRSYLGGIYRQFLRSDDVEIWFNGERVTYDEPAVLTAPPWNDPAAPPVEWRVPIDIALASGRQVIGFVAIREVGSTADAGLALFYRRKVVTGAGDESYRPTDLFGAGNTFRSQRLFGELHMDDFAVTYTKDAIVWYDEEDEFIDLLRKRLSDERLPLLRQADNYRTRSVTERRDVVHDIVERTAALLESAGDDIAGDDPPPNELAAAQPRPASVFREDREVQLPVDGTTWTVRLRLVADDANEDWVRAVRDQVGGSPTVTITVNQAHPFMRAFCELPNQDLESVWRIAIAVGLAQELARHAGVTRAGTVTQKVNKLLRTTLSRQV